MAVYSLDAKGDESTIDRKPWVERHNPAISAIDPESPFTVGNGHFAFTADVTGLQTFTGLYYDSGIPLETKARWAWHSRSNDRHYTLEDTNVEYAAYGRKVNFPTNMDSAAGQWLRSNPHDLPLARIGLVLNGEEISSSLVTDIDQTLDMWRGRLESRYSLDGQTVSVSTVAHGERDVIAAKIESSLVDSGRLGVILNFPRGYDLNIKNTPRIDWHNDGEHITQLIEKHENTVVFLRQVDDEKHFVRINWQGHADLIKSGDHSYQLRPRMAGIEGKAAGNGSLEFSVEFSQTQGDAVVDLSFDQTSKSAAASWEQYWNTGAAVDFAGSSDTRANELERRIVLSQYLLGVQARSDIPAQETGLTSSSWYGKHHTEMAWWHTAHWILWGRNENAERVLAWYLETMGSAAKVAGSRGLKGVRWSKMVGPDGRESPGGNPLIIWNQPQVIHLAEMLYQSNPTEETLFRYAGLVEETAQGLSSMLSWDQAGDRFSLEPPIWIAQEIYDPLVTRNPGFELSYWRYGLRTAQLWRKRLDKNENTEWNKQVTQLAELPRSEGKYVAIESVPDTFTNFQSRQDHPTMLAPYGLLNDETVDPDVMGRTLQAVLDTWDWDEKIWGWDYPMIAMTAVRLGEPEIALDILLRDAPHNRYLSNGHCPQEGAGLPVYLPANGAFLAATAMLVPYWETGGRNGEWRIRVDGLKPLNDYSGVP